MTRRASPQSQRLERELASLVTGLATLLQTALEVHEELERSTGRSPVAELSEALAIDPLAVPLEHVATVLFAVLVLGAPALTRSQELLQERLLERLERGPRMLFRQLRTEPLRGWRYLPQPASRDVAAQLAGPERGREEFFDALLDLGRGAREPHGGACLGWPLTTSSGGHVLIAAALLAPQSEQAVEALAPFPMPRSERAFWDENQATLVRLCVDPLGLLRTRAAREADQETVDPAAFRDGARLVLYPASTPGELLERLVVAADFELIARGNSWYSPQLRRVRHARELIARARAGDDLASLVQALTVLRYQLLGWSGQTRFTGADDPALEAWLPLERVLEGLGTAPDASMPAAQPHLLKTHPVSVLALDAQHPVFAEIHNREPVRQALDWARRHPGPPADALDAAFERYSDERRWLATFAPLDLERDDHLERIDLAVILHGLCEVFDARVLRTPLSELTGLDSRQLGWLESALRERPYTDENVLRVADLPREESRLLRLRNIGRGSLAQLKRGLMALADGWRAIAAGLDPRSLEPSSRGSTALHDASLLDGLDELAALFGEPPGDP